MGNARSMSPVVDENDISDTNLMHSNMCNHLPRRREVTQPIRNGLLTNLPNLPKLQHSLLAACLPLPACVEQSRDEKFTKLL